MAEPGSRATSAAPALWVVSPHLGWASEVWLLRQLQEMHSFRPVSLTWSDVRGLDVMPELEVHQMVEPPPARLSETGAARWWGRAIRAPSRNYLAATGEEVVRLGELAAETCPVALLCHFGQTALRMLPVARTLGLPMAVHFHGNDLSSSLRNRWYRWSLLRHLPAFDAMVVVGERQREWLLSQGVAPERVHLIPCGVPVAEFARAQPAAAGPVHFVTVSRLVPQKGVEVSLAAFAEVAAAAPEARMTIIGDGPERAALEAQAQAAGLQDRVYFAGSLAPEAVRATLETATAFLQHSRDLGGWFEGFGVSATEAAAMQLPLVVSCCGGLVDQVADGETGFVVEQGDVAGMADAMRRLALDPALAARMGEAGRARVAELYDTPDQVGKLEAVLARLITEAGEKGSCL